METFQEHYLSMKRTIAARKLNVDMALIDRAVDYARHPVFMTPAAATGPRGS